MKTTYVLTTNTHAKHILLLVFTTLILLTSGCGTTGTGAQIAGGVQSDLTTKGIIGVGNLAGKWMKAAITDQLGFLPEGKIKKIKKGYASECTQYAEEKQCAQEADKLVVILQEDAKECEEIQDSTFKRQACRDKTLEEAGIRARVSIAQHKARYYNSLTIK